MHRFQCHLTHWAILVKPLFAVFGSKSRTRKSVIIIFCDSSLTVTVPLSVILEKQKVQACGPYRNKEWFGWSANLPQNRQFCFITSLLSVMYYRPHLLIHKVLFILCPSRVWSAIVRARQSFSKQWSFLRFYVKPNLFKIKLISVSIFIIGGNSTWIRN